MTESIPEFGAPVAGADYRLRPGGYVILRNEAGEIAVVVTRKGVFLPGGGQERGETPEIAAVRETLEECGLVVRLRGFVGTADELVYAGAKRGYFRKRCSFFAATMISRSTDVVPEHALSWLAPAEAVARLSDGSQRWAVSRAVSLEPGGLLPPPTGREEG